MLSDAMIMDIASKQAFSRGEDLVSTGAVGSVDISQRSGSSQVRLTGTIGARSGPSYTATVTLDLDQERILKHRCSCPSFSSSGEFCKHCVALALTYLDASAAHQQPKASLEGDVAARLKSQTRDLLAQYRAESQSAPATPFLIQEAQTSPQIARAVWACTQAQQLNQTPDLPAVPAEVYPLLSPGAKPREAGASDSSAATWEVRLRVGSGSTIYLVKQVDELIRAWEAGAPYTYGRNLSFTHSRAAFSERANRVLEVLAGVFRTQAAARASSYAHQGAVAHMSAKMLPLSDADAVRLLDAMMGSEIQFEPRVFSGSAKPRTLVVVEGDPSIPLAIHAGERGGFDLDLPMGSDCIVTDDCLYVLHDARAWRCSPAFRTRAGAFLRSVLPTSQALHIRTADMPAFCGSVLPLLKTIGPLEAPAELDALLPPAARATFRCSLTRSQVVCDASITYGNVSVGLFEPLRPGQPLRDGAREQLCRAAVSRYFEPLSSERRDGVTRLVFDAGDVEALHRFLTEGLRALSELGEVMLSEQLRTIRVRPAPRLRLNANLHSGLLDLAVDSSDMSPHDLQAYLASFERRENFVRLESGDIVRLDDELRSIAELADDLGISALDLLTGKRSLPANRALFVDAMLQRCTGISFEENDAFQAVVQAFDALGSVQPPIPQGLRGTLRPYQCEGFSWLSTLASLGFGGILADDMGLGKTLQVITFLLAQHEAGRSEPSLVVCPASLIYNWEAELQRFAPDLGVAIVAGSPEDRRALIQTARGYDVLVTSYELLKRDIELYERQRFYCQILDEAQYIKNHTTQAARSVKRVQAAVRLALTGTPIENRLSELWSIFDFLMPGLLGSYDAFRRRFEIPIAEGDEAASGRLQCMVSPFILRRMKNDVLRDLPEKTESIVYASMEGEQSKLYRATASQLALTLSHQLPSEFSADRIAILAELTKLRQICCDPHLLYENYEGESAKLETCLELVANAVDAGHKVLLFSQFTSMLSIIAGRLEQASIRYHKLVGSTSKEERARLVASFQTDDVPVFLVSLKAGGVGLNLTAADIVIHYDPWWNLAAQNQATDRAHRIGQTNTVNVMRLIAKGTIEEKIVGLQEAKRDLAERIIGGEAIGNAQLTRDDILALLEE